MIREQIKIQTKPQHDAVEEVSYSSQIMDHSLNKEQYQQLVRINYILNSSFEDTWNKLPFDLPEGLMIEHRRKANMLKSDLELLGLEQPELSTVPFDISSYPAFMGALYVFEGSTLGGAVILKQLQKNENLNGIDNFHFYGAYGERIGMMWKLFLDELEKIQDESEVDECIAAAQKTFDWVREAFSSKSAS